MPVSAYPKELTDAYWKKVESRLKVSNTGVGQTLRNLEKLYKDFVTKVDAFEKAGTDAAGTKKAVTALTKALDATETTLMAHYQKLKGKGRSFDKDPEMKVLDRYMKAVSGISHDAAGIITGSDAGQAVKRYNDRLKMWAGFINKPG